MAMLDAMPLIKLPTTWPLPVVATLCMAALGAGALSFLVLFWVYASSLQYAELAVVTMGWIVLLQVGILLIDHFHFDTSLPTGKLVAVVIILAAQGYLVLGPSGATA